VARLTISPEPRQSGASTFVKTMHTAFVGLLHKQQSAQALRTAAAPPDASPARGPQRAADALYVLPLLCGAAVRLVPSGHTHPHPCFRSGPGKDGGKATAEELPQQQQLKKALFGALYTLAKEKINDTARMAYLTIMVDFMLICCLFLMPEYPWAADAHHP
jgi:hypothetical protein